MSNIFQTKKTNRKYEIVKTDIQCKKPKDCSVCNKRNCKTDKSVICNNCYSPVHRKCSKLKPTEISDLKNDRNLKWECTTCLNDKFPFTFFDDKYIMSNTFNSNFDCRCNTSSNFQLGSSKYIFQNNLDNLKKTISLTSLMKMIL